MWSKLTSETGSPKGCMHLEEETVSGTIGAKTLSEEKRRTVPFMSNSLNLEETIRFIGGIELLDEKFDFWSLKLMSGKTDDDMKLDMLSLTEEAEEGLDTLPGNGW